MSNNIQQIEMTNEMFHRFLELLKVFDFKDTFEDVQIKNGLIRSESTNRLFNISIDISDIFPYDLDIMMIKSKLKLFKHFQSDKKDHIISINLGDKAMGITDGITNLKIRHPAVAALTNTYIDDAEFLKRNGDTPFFQTVLTENIIKKIISFSDIFSDDKVYIAIQENKIEFKMKSKSKNEYCTIIEYECNTIPSILKKSVAALNIAAIQNIYNGDMCITLYKFDDTTVEENTNNRISIQLESVIQNTSVIANTLCLLQVNKNAVIDPNEVIEMEVVEFNNNNAKVVIKNKQKEETKSETTQEESKQSITEVVNEVILEKQPESITEDTSEHIQENVISTAQEVVNTTEPIQETIIETATPNLTLPTPPQMNIQDDFSVQIPTDDVPAPPQNQNVMFNYN